VAGPFTNAFGARWAFGAATGAVALATVVASRFVRRIEPAASRSTLHQA